MLEDSNSGVADGIRLLIWELEVMFSFWTQLTFFSLSLPPFSSNRQQTFPPVSDSIEQLRLCKQLQRGVPVNGRNHAHRNEGQQPKANSPTNKKSIFPKSLLDLKNKKEIIFGNKLKNLWRNTAKYSKIS